MQVLPSSRLGRVAGWLGLAFIVWFFVVNNAIVALRQRYDFAPRTALIAQGLLGFGVGLASSVVALVALTRHKDRALVVWLCLVPGLIVVAFLFGELLVPH